jgi:hypothetical protein
MFTVQHHGTSGRWYPAADNVATMFDALSIAERLKQDGYGARILREDKSVAMDASWQTEVDWTVSS